MEFILLYLAPRGLSLPRQTFGLSLLGLLFVTALLATRSESLTLWWQTGGPLVLLGIVLGIRAYALTTAYGRAVATDLRSAPRREAA